MAISDLSVELSLDTSTAEKKYQKFTQTINKQSVNVNVEMNTGNAEEELASIADLLSEINETIKPKVTQNVETQQQTNQQKDINDEKDKHAGHHVRHCSNGLVLCLLRKRQHQSLRLQQQ